MNTSPGRADKVGWPERIDLRWSSQGTDTADLQKLTTSELIRDFVDISVEQDAAIFRDDHEKYNLLLTEMIRQTHKPLFDSAPGE